MRKISKVLAILLCVVVFTSVFTIASSAISSSSSARDILRYYEQCNIDTSAKEDVIKVRAQGTESITGDFSGLTSADRQFTMDMLEWEDSYDEWDEDHFVYGDAYPEHYVNGRSMFVDVFSVNRDIKRDGLTYKGAKYSVDKNGNEVMTFDAVLPFESGNMIYLTYTVTLDANGYIQTYKLRQYSDLRYESFLNNDTFTVTKIIDETFTFEYKEIDVESVRLSRSKVTVGVGKESSVRPVITPNNATFKDVYAISDDRDIATCYVDNGKIYIEGIREGSTTIEVYTYDGDLLAECEVVVGRTFMDSFGEFFISLFDLLFGFLNALL
ncbi:MAG: hypothetical protein E7536_04105 [Ruminococcaceae bacterium]|nr:hypothetical protein [Oscillospiraceae bacterium]